jgi:predicted esterase
VALITALVAGGANGAEESQPTAPSPRQTEAQPGATRAERIKLLDRTTAIAYQKEFRNERLAAWQRRVPQVALIRVRSSLDGDRQKVLWYDSGSHHRKPLLVVLHSWSADYQQNLDIPFAEFAIKNDWAFIHPDFRGPNKRPQAAASKQAVQDVMDAVAEARRRGTIDESRIYLVGYSGGAMKALVLAARHPELWAGVAAWGAVYDIPDWYRHNRRLNQAHYVDTITASCGGAPSPGSRAEANCRARSPSSQLAAAAGKVPILIAHGLADRTVPPRHAIDAFDALAARDDRFTAAERDQIDAHATIPTGMHEQSLDVDPLFAAAGAPARLERHSQEVTLVLYQGGHDMVYNAALEWLAKQHRRSNSPTFSAGRGAPVEPSAPAPRTSW